MGSAELEKQIQKQQEGAYIAKLRSRRRPELFGVPLFGQSYLKGDDVLEGLPLTDVEPTPQARRALVQGVRRIYVDSRALARLDTLEQAKEILITALRPIGGSL